MNNLRLQQACALFALVILAAPVTRARQPYRLYAGLANSKGYVVGAPLKPSGLHVYAGDTTWQLIGWKHPRVSAVTKDPADPNIIYLACGNGCMKSADGGKSWKITTGWQVTEAQSICVDPHAPEQVYLATAYGIWRSVDRGESWVEANDGLQKKYTQVIRADLAQKEHLLAGTEGGIFFSDDAGRHWRLAGARDQMALALEQSPTNPQIWIAGTQDRGVWLSRDGGKRWQALEQPGLSHSAIYAVAIDPFDSRNMAAAGWDTWVWLSDDGGRRWRQVRSELPVDDFYALAYDKNVRGRLWAATVEAGIYATSDAGATWQFKGMYGSLVFDLVFLPESAR